MAGNPITTIDAAWIVVCDGGTEGRAVYTLICNKLMHVTHNAKREAGRLKYVVVEIVPGTSNHQSIFIPDIFSSPKKQKK